MNQMNRNVMKKLLPLFISVVSLFSLPIAAWAASISLSPATGVYTSGSTFTVQVRVNTGGAAINAADGTISYNPRELSVVSVSKGSVFNLWTSEPSFSNSAGTVSFSGGSPTGYTGSGGTVISITFRALTSGSSKVSMTNGSVLAADGRGTNVLTSMSGGTYTLSAVTSQPDPEVIVEYVPPANTPGAPSVSSATHKDQEAWHTAKTAELSWNLPSDITAVRTLLSSSQNAVPTKVYDSPIRTISIPDLPEGVSYFHIQFRNEDGWGRIARYRLAVDSKKPEGMTLSLTDDADLTRGEQTLVIGGTNEGSPLTRYKLQVDGGQPIESSEWPKDNRIALSALPPGYHTAVLEVFDAAGNSEVLTTAFTIQSFDKPVFIDPPTRISEGMIPVFRGQTRKNSEVRITVTPGTAESVTYTVRSDGDGNFAFFPDRGFSSGAYRLIAEATDEHGAVSAPSDEVRFIVERPGYIAVGMFVISVLSLLIPIIGLAVLLALGAWYSLHRWRSLRSNVGRESVEAVSILHTEFANLRYAFRTQVEQLSAARKTKKLTKGEVELAAAFEAALSQAEGRVTKEMEDVTKLVKKQ